MPTSVADAPRTTPPADPAARLRRLVDRDARLWRRLRLVELAALAVAPPVAVLLAAVGLDAWLHLPAWGRAAAALAVVASAAGPLARGRGGPSGEDEVALAIERRTGGVQNRLINALQLARDGRASALTDEVVRENVRRLEAVNLPHAARGRPALVRAGVVGLLVALGVAFWVWRPDAFANAAGRVLLPFADIKPLYRTLLEVEPGRDVEAAGDVTVTVRVKGERPDAITLLRTVAGKRTAEDLPLEPGRDAVSHTIRGVRESQTYAVRGGDFLSPTYRIDVPALARLTAVRATLQLPAYTQKPPVSVERAGGDLEALQGTRAELSFSFDRPVDAAVMRVEAVGGVRTVELTPAGAAEWKGAVTFDGVMGYSVETRQGERPAVTHGPFALRVLADQPPKAELAGVDAAGEVAVDAVLPLKLAATDDYGLAKVGLFVRRGDARPAADDGWQPVQVWDAKNAAEWRRGHEFAVASLGAVEGDRLELTARAADADPLKQGAWTPGPVARLQVGGEGAFLQRQYEQLVRTEAELRALGEAARKAAARAEEWQRKLDAGSGLRWDDPKNLDALHAAAREQAGAAEAARRDAGAAARAMLPEAGAVRQGLGLLADTEMVRAVRTLEGVRDRDTPQAKRAALADARATLDRTARSLGEMLEQHAAFRRDWELAHMVPFAQMLAERQARLRDQAAKLADAAAPAGLAAQSLSRRQAKVLELVRLVQPAFAALGERLKATEPLMGKAFADGAAALAAPALADAVMKSSAALAAAKWADARPGQEHAAAELAALYVRLKKAQADAAAAALAALQEKAKHDAEAQKALKKLQAGSADATVALPDRLKLEEIIHMREQAQKGTGDGTPGPVNDYLLPDSAKASLQGTDTGKRQEFDLLKLATAPSKTPSFPKQSDREANQVTPLIQEKFDDLVGKLLEEADEMKEKYESLNLNAAFNINEPGEIGKQGGDLNSNAAASATGNMKPPATNVGGTSRSGRRGARAHGLVVGDETINRRGRDQVQEGQERTQLQAGTMKEKKSEDMQKDTSTGFGGKKVESDEPNKFSTADAGKWTDDMAAHMDKPKEKFGIVERQDGRLDPKVAELLRDLNSTQEQVLERVKAIRKELRNLYLPTDHLDDLAAKLRANLEALKERPDPELFRQQGRLLDQLRNTVKVFQPPQSGFAPSLPREQAVKGRVLDEPAREPLPGYEEATRRYYERLAAR